MSDTHRAPAPAETPAEERHTHWFRRWLKFIVIGAVIIVVGGGLAAYFGGGSGVQDAKTAIDRGQKKLATITDADATIKKLEAENAALKEKNAALQASQNTAPPVPKQAEAPATQPPKPDVKAAETPAPKPATADGQKPPSRVTVQDVRPDNIEQFYKKF